MMKAEDLSDIKVGWRKWIGQRVKIIGKFETETFNTFVDLTECRLDEVGPDPAIEVTAVDLARTYAAGEKAADAKYKAKWLRVEGKVAEVNQNDFVTVLLEGVDDNDKRVRVKVSFSPEYKEVGLKRGDIVKMKGECVGLSIDGETVGMNNGRLVQ